MQIIEVFGGKDQATATLVEDYASYVMYEIFNIKKSFDIQIELGSHDTQGGCIALEGNEFHVEIDENIEHEELATCVFHEMVHVAQHLLNKITEKNGRSYWYGEDHTDTPYLEKPWEKEAYIQQEVILSKYKKSLKEVIYA
mgnify:FL=1